MYSPCSLTNISSLSWSKVVSRSVSCSVLNSSNVGNIMLSSIRLRYFLRTTKSHKTRETWTTAADKHLHIL